MQPGRCASRAPALWIAFAASAIAAASAAAEEARPAASDAAAGEVEEILVVETRLDEALFAIGDAASIDGERLADILPVDPEHLFQRLPGFAVSRPGGPGGVSEVFQRGAESNFTAVYVDGVRLNNPSNTRGGSYDFSLLATQDIGGVDVASGAMSAIYGADAMAGVIRIRSAWPEPGSVTAMLEGGSEGQWRLGAGTSLDVGNDAVLSLRASSLDGGSEIDGSSLRLDGAALRLAGGESGDAGWEFGVRHVQRDRSSFPEVSGGPELAVDTALETATGSETSIGGGGNWRLTDRWTTEVFLSGSRIADDAFVPAVAPGVLDGQPAFSTDLRYDRRQLLWINHFLLADGLRLVAGTDFVSEEGRDNGAVDLGFAIVPNAYRLDRRQSSAFVEIGREWRGGFVATLAVRRDHSDGDGRNSGKLAIAKAVGTHGSRIWARVADGFKLPSFFALGNPLFGNPGLAAEKVQSAELGYTHAGGTGGELSLSGFRNRYENLVDFDFETFTNINAGRIEVSGFEFHAAQPVSPTIRLSVDATLSSIESRSGPLRRRPERMGGIDLDWAPASAWHLNVSARYVGPRLITSIPTGDIEAPAYVLVGAALRYEPRPVMAFWLAADNILDEEYQEAPGFPSPGAALRLGARFAY